MKHTATCCCESISIIIEGTPYINAVCHCENCKKRTGSAFGISVYFKSEQVVEIHGNTEVYKIDNETNQERHFCKQCGTTLHWYTSSLPGYIGIAGGCFNAMPFPEPMYTLSNQNKCSWLSLPTHFKEQL